MNMDEWIPAGDVKTAEIRKGNQYRLEQPG